MKAPRGIVAAYALSGACALVYQVVWTHAFTERFGASETTFLVVLCAFIGGLGLGAILSRRTYAALERRFGGRGLRNYGGTEIAIAVSSVVLLGDSSSCRTCCGRSSSRAARGAARRSISSGSGKIRTGRAH